MDAPYQRLADLLRARIASGEWSSGSQVPSARALGEEYGQGRGVVEKAVRELRREGILEGKPGARLTVAPPQVTLHTLDDPDADWPHGRGDKPRHARLMAGERLAKRLQVTPRTHLDRERVDLLFEDQRPAMLLTTWRRGTTIRPHASYRRLVRFSTLSRDEADVLGLARGIPVLVLERTRYDAEGRPVEAADLVLPADRWEVDFGVTERLE